MRIIRVDAEREHDLWFSSSPDMKGLVVHARKRDELLNKLAPIITDMFKAMGEAVTCHRATMASGSDAGDVMGCAAVFVITSHSQG